MNKLIPAAHFAHLTIVGILPKGLRTRNIKVKFIIKEEAVFVIRTRIKLRISPLRYLKVPHR